MSSSLHLYQNTTENVIIIFVHSIYTLVSLPTMSALIMSFKNNILPSAITSFYRCLPSDKELAFVYNRVIFTSGYVSRASVLGADYLIATK